MTTDFDEILDQPIDDIPDELAISPGTWVFRGKALAETEDTFDDDGELVEGHILFVAEAIEPLTGVDPETAEEFLASNPEPVVFQRIRGTERVRRARLKTIARALRLSTLGALTSCIFSAKVVHNKSKDGTRVFINLKNFAPYVIEQPAAAPGTSIEVYENDEAF